MSTPASIRLTTEADIPALLSLLLTSFRQFELFSFLYSPLYTNKEAAHDTIWVWRRRLLIGLLDPATNIIVAEIDEGISPTLVKREQVEGDGLQEESWRMLEWVTSRGRLSQSSKVIPRKVIVGFAIWRDREGEKVKRDAMQVQKPGLIARLRSKSFLRSILSPDEYPLLLYTGDEIPLSQRPSTNSGFK
jgi:hypothetical protein